MTTTSRDRGRWKQWLAELCDKCKVPGTPKVFAKVRDSAESDTRP
jgi:hypothetical protein